jgi:hypothetical protein
VQRAGKILGDGWIEIQHRVEILSDTSNTVDAPYPFFGNVPMAFGRLFPKMTDGLQPAPFAVFVPHA